MTSDELSAIQQTLAAYCHRVDHGTPAEVAELFAEDAILMPRYDGDYDVRGREGVRDWYAFYQRQMTETVKDLRHSISTALIDMDGDSASSSCHLTAYFTMKEDNVTYQVQGTYFDTLVRSGKAWMFQSRRIEIQHINRVGEAIERMRPMGFPGAAK